MYENWEQCPIEMIEVLFVQRSRAVLWASAIMINLLVKLLRFYYPLLYSPTFRAGERQQLSAQAAVVVLARRIVSPK